MNIDKYELPSTMLSRAKKTVTNTITGFFEDLQSTLSNYHQRNKYANRSPSTLHNMQDLGSTTAAVLDVKGDMVQKVNYFDNTYVNLCNVADIILDAKVPIGVNTYLFKAQFEGKNFLIHSDDQKFINAVKNYHNNKTALDRLEELL